MVPVDVVIVAHNSGPLLGEAVQSAVAQAGPKHIWVMDAASTDGSVDALRGQESLIHILPVANAGFAAANNRGIEATESPYVLLLNPDAVLCDGALDHLLSVAEENPRSGMIGPMVINPDGSAQANSFGRFPSLATSLGLRAWRVWQRLRGNVALSPKTPAFTTEVDWVTGACALVRRAAIRDAGPMDEGFFLYYEDTEWCRRLRDHGWRVLLAPGALAVHHLGGSGTANVARSVAYRASFYRYCDLRGLWGLKLVSRCGLLVRRLAGGAP